MYTQALQTSLFIFLLFCNSDLSFYFIFFAASQFFLEILYFLSVSFVFCLCPFLPFFFFSGCHL